jgi:CarD family transcriptional regulator
LATKKKPETTTKKKTTTSTAKKSTTATKKKTTTSTAKKSTTATKKKSTTPAKKKPAAKKSTTPATKKPAAKKSTTPATKKPAAKKSTTPAKKEPAAAKPVIPFAVGDKVVYPHHGAATIIKKQKLDVGGEKRDYFILEIATDQLTVSVPVDSAVELGVRPVISRNKARQVFATLRSEPQEAGSNWSRWYKVLTEKINSGDIFQVAEVIRDLDYAQKIKGISPALKRMLAKARLIIISELQFSLKISEEEAIKKLERALPKIEELAEV